MALGPDLSEQDLSHDEEFAHPLDTIEQLVDFESSERIERDDREELFFSVSNHAGFYAACFTWQPEEKVLHFVLMCDTHVPRKRLVAIERLLRLVNSHVAVGSFCLMKSDRRLMLEFRHALFLEGTSGVSHAQIQDLLANAHELSEQFFPAFLQVLAGGNPERACRLALTLVPQGNA